MKKERNDWKESVSCGFMLNWIKRGKSNDFSLFSKENVGALACTDIYFRRIDWVMQR